MIQNIQTSLLVLYTDLFFTGSCSKLFLTITLIFSFASLIRSYPKYCLIESTFPLVLSLLQLTEPGYLVN